MHGGGLAKSAPAFLVFDLQPAIQPWASTDRQGFREIRPIGILTEHSAIQTFSHTRPYFRREDGLSVAGFSAV